MKSYLICTALLAALPGWAHQPPSHSLDTCDMVATYAEASGLPVELAVSTAYYESKLNMGAKNPRSSARGPMQILRPWCKHGDCDTVDSTKRMTVLVGIDDGVIAVAPPIVRRFIGQPTRNLGQWMWKQPGFRGKWLDIDDE